MEAEPGMRPGRRRRIFIGASLALLLTGLGTAAAYALSTHTTRAAQRPTTSIATNQSATVADTTTAPPARKTGTTSGKGHHDQHNSSKQTRSGGDRGKLSMSTAPTATTGNSHKSAPQAKPVTISDAFAGDYVNPNTWAKVLDGYDVGLLEQGGQLQLTVGDNAVPGGPSNQIDVHVATRCAFPADFDARVNYGFLEWPAGDNIDVGMDANATAAVMRDSSSQVGEEYASWVGTTSRSVPLSNTSGYLRIARVKGIETTYFWHRGHWQKLAQARAIGPVVIGLQALSDGQGLFGGQELKVAFDNFKVTGTKPDCPPGALPASR
jgi:hypothetical protein